MAREIILDTETTGLERKTDRIIEIACVEIDDYIPTGRTYHRYINPQHPVSKGALKIHGLSDQFLKGKPTFRQTVNSFLTFIEGARLVAHNAPFDVGMINAELDRLNYPHLDNEIVDSLALAREVIPKGRHTLDALCKRYDIDTSKRTKHGALLDCELLAAVYVELRGGRQFGMELELAPELPQKPEPARQRPVPLVRTISEDDRLIHEAFVRELGPDAIWLKYMDLKSDAA